MKTINYLLSVIMVALFTWGTPQTAGAASGQWDRGYIGNKNDPEAVGWAFDHKSHWNELVIWAEPQYDATEKGVPRPSVAGMAEYPWIAYGKNNGEVWTAYDIYLTEIEEGQFVDSRMYELRFFTDDESRVMPFPGIIGAGYQYLDGGQSRMRQIKAEAFKGCYLLRRIDIPPLVTHIGLNAFSGCNALAEIKSYAELPPNNMDGGSMFSTSHYSTCKLIVPNGSIADYKAHSEWGKFTNIVNFSGQSSEISASRIQEIRLPVSDITLNIGEERSITATILPEDAENKQVRWVSDRPGAATVELQASTGVAFIKAVGAGLANIICISEAYEHIRDTVRVTVPTGIGLTSITLNPSATGITLYKGSSYTINYTVLPENAVNKNVRVTTGNVAVASVTYSTGQATITGVGIGATDISFISEASESVLATVHVTVPDGTTGGGTGITLSPSEIFISAVGVAQKVTATLTSGNAGNTNFRWESQNTGVATVSTTANSAEVYVTAVGFGSTTLSCISLDDGNIRATVPVTVGAVETKITLDKKEVFFASTNAPDQTIDAEIVPSNTTVDVTWKSNNPDVVLAVPSPVNQMQLILTPMSVGATTITCTAKNTDGTIITASASVTVQNSKFTWVDNITLIGGSDVIITDYSQQELHVSAIVSPSNASNLNVQWESNNLNVASIAAVPNVVNRALVTVKGFGTARITCSAKDNGGASASFKVTVGEMSSQPSGLNEIDSQTVFYSEGRTLHISTPSAEQIAIYGINGAKLSGFGKQPGEVTYSVAPQHKVLIVRGSSGWAHKVVL